MGELPHQGFERVMLEDFGSDVAINICHPSEHFMARERDHQGPGVHGPAEDGLKFVWAALCGELLLGYEYRSQEWSRRG